MRQKMKAALAGFALVWVGSLLTAPGWASDRVANPESVFARGMKWIEKNGENKGVLQLSPHGTAIMNWNGRTYWGHWEKVGEYHVRTTWKKSGGPPGGVWSIRETGNPEFPYVASRRAP